MGGYGYLGDDGGTWTHSWRGSSIQDTLFRKERKYGMPL